jgi:hypothetical protein
MNMFSVPKYTVNNMLYQIARPDPWYADIVNFMVAGYVRPGVDKKKLIYKSRHHLWDEPYHFRVCSDGLLLTVNFCQPRVLCYTLVSIVNCN